jgi:hypothetical protein
MTFKKLHFLLGIILFILFFLSFLSVKLWDCDYWWHIATGREIVVSNHIASLDKFNFVNGHNRLLYPELTLREPFLMKSYWLSQVAFYWVYESLGSWGIVFLRSLLLTFVLWLMYRGLRSEGGSELFSFLLLIPSFFILFHKYTGERPVLFTFVFSLAVFLLMNSIHRERLKKIIYLPPLMLLWANLHGAFILGLVIILAFWVEETMRLVLNRSQFSGKEYAVITAIIAASVLITIINPSGWDVFVLTADARQKFFEESVQEYQPLLAYYLRGEIPIDPYIITVLSVAGIAMLTRIARMRLSHIILLGGFLTMGLLHQRFFVFCATIGIVIAGKELISIWQFLSSKFSLLSRPSLRIAASFVAVSCIVLFAGQTSYAVSTQLRTWSADHSRSTGQYAVEFIRNNRIPGRMFNSDAVGGYLIWEFYPWKQVFSDTRSTDVASRVEYSFILRAEPGPHGERPVWERLLDMYDVNFMVIAPQDNYGGMITLVKDLLESDRWALVHHDPGYMIFVKNSDLNSELIERYRISPDDAYWLLVYKASHMLLTSPNRYLYATVGHCFEKLGEYDEAVKAYRAALESKPEDKELLDAIERVTALAGSVHMASK